jgi:hypothetical protein
VADVDVEGFPIDDAVDAFLDVRRQIVSWNGRHADFAKLCRTNDALACRLRSELRRLVGCRDTLSANEWSRVYRLADVLGEPFPRGRRHPERPPIAA